jgi:hypothetical protein
MLQAQQSPQLCPNHIHNEAHQEGNPLLHFFLMVRLLISIERPFSFPSVDCSPKNLRNLVVPTAAKE